MPIFNSNQRHSRLFVAASSQCFQCPGASLATGSAAYPFSIALWYFPVTLVTGSLMQLAGGNPTGGYAGPFVINTGTVRAQIDSGDQSASNAETTATTPLKQWSHIANVFASTTSRSVYLNGANKVTNTTSEAFPIMTGAATLTVGAQGPTWITSGNRSFANGRIALPALWNVALSDADVMRLAEGALPSEVRPEGLVVQVDLVTGRNLAMDNSAQSSYIFADSNGSSLSGVCENIHIRPPRAVRFGVSAAAAFMPAAWHVGRQAVNRTGTY